MQDIYPVIKIGVVISIKGRSVDIRVDKSKNSSHLLFKGELIKNVSVGSYIKILKGFEQLIGKIEGEYITEEKSNSEYHNEKDRIKRVLNVNLMGYLEAGEFKRGIKELPLIDNECCLLTQSEFDSVHKFVKLQDHPIDIGTLAQEKGKRIEIGVNSLFASHIGIFGNTGSGKSYTLASLYNKLISKYIQENSFKSSARFILIDFNGEYVSEPTTDNIIIDSRHKKNYALSTGRSGSINKIPVLSETINDVSFWALILHATEKTQTPFITRSLSSEYLNENIRSTNGFKELLIQTITRITTQVNLSQERNLVISFLEEILRYNFSDQNSGLLNLLEDYEYNLEFHSKDKYYFYKSSSTTYFSTTPESFIENVIIAKIQRLNIDIRELSEIYIIRLKFIFQYYYEILKGYSIKDHIAPLIGRLDRRINDLSKVLTMVSNNAFEETLSVVSLRDVNIEMRKVLPLIVCKQIYELKKKQYDGKKYLNIIIDEAHNILSYNSERESESWKDYRLETFEEIIKEGRKFGVFLTVASQRPSDISTTIISQLHNYFLHRLINIKDIEAIEKTVSYLDKVSFDSLPLLPTGTCIFAGVSAEVPVVIEVDKISDTNKPNNQTIILTKNWLDNQTDTTNS